MARNTITMTGRFDFRFFIRLDFQGIKAVLHWCQSMKLISSEYQCPECHSQMVIEEKLDDIDGCVWVCRQEGDHKHFIERSVRQGSFFQQINLRIIDTLLLTYLWIAKAEIEFMEEELKLTKATVDEWLNFCREACVTICINKNTLLGGEDVIVEMIECKFLEKKYVLKDCVVGDWVYVGFEKETDKAFMEVVNKQDEKHLLKVIKKYILPGTILVSHCWKLYDCLDHKEFMDLEERQNIKFEHFGVGIGSSLQEMRARVKKLLKSVLRGSPDFDIHLAEYMWRRTYSDDTYELTNAFLKEIVILYPPHIKDPI